MGAPRKELRAQHSSLPFGVPRPILIPCAGIGMTFGTRRTVGAVWRTPLVAALIALLIGHALHVPLLFADAALARPDAATDVAPHHARAHAQPTGGRHERGGYAPEVPRPADHAAACAAGVTADRERGTPAPAFSLAARGACPDSLAGAAESLPTAALAPPAPPGRRRALLQIYRI